MSLTTERIDLLARLLDVAALRQDVIAQNVANLNTPGYRTLVVDFEDALKEAIQNGAPANLPGVQPQVAEGPGGMDRDDGNNVDVDREMGRLQKNALYFKAYTQLITNELAQYRSAISGR